MRKEDRDFLDLIAQTIFDKKGFNILALDVRPCATLADYVVLAEGTVDRHVIAIAHAVEKTLAEVGEKPVHIEGDKVGDWVVIDYGAVVVHLFMPGMREKYQLEQLWQKGEIVDVQIAV